MHRYHRFPDFVSIPCRQHGNIYLIRHHWMASCTDTFTLDSEIPNTQHNSFFEGRLYTLLSYVWLRRSLILREFELRSCGGVVSTIPCCVSTLLAWVNQRKRGHRPSSTVDISHLAHALDQCDPDIRARVLLRTHLGNGVEA